MSEHARVVIIGGGVMGVGLLYHLVHEGWRDVVLLEKGELTSGSTWHAAGLIPHFIGSLTMAKIHLYGSELYRRLEEETGQATGWHGCGAIRLATNRDEVDWFHYVQGVLRNAGAECHLIGPNEVKELHPLLDVHGVLLGAYTPHDGHTDPASTTNAMAAGARSAGATIRRHCRVLDVTRRASGEWEVTTEQGSIVAEHVVNAAGSFASQVAAMVGVGVPIVNMIHQYLVTEPVPAVAALTRELPVVRDPVASCYYRQEQRGLIIGPYEMADARAWGLDGIDWSFDMELLPPDIERLSPSLELAMQRIPAFAEAGIKRVVSGPITHTPDGNFLLGPAPGLDNYWMCCGASIGITQGAGAGKYLAQWMVHGQTEINVRELDPRRYGDWALGRYALDKSIDEYQQMYQVHYPGEYREAGRPVKRTPVHEALAARGAVFAEVFGWERAKWFAPPGVDEEYGFRRTNCFAHVARECAAVRERAGITDLTSFTKLEVSGADAAALLDRLCCNRLPRRDGGIVLTQMLTALGGIECEATVTRLAHDRYLLLSAAVAELHDRDWLSAHVRRGEDVRIENVTAVFGGLMLSGPASRALLAPLAEASLDNADFPWLTAREIEVAGVACRALRISYAGELGWELYCPVGDLRRLYDAIVAAGDAHGLAHVGTYAINSLRMEKAYRAWGVELTTEVTPIEADLEKFVAFDKGDFIGREALLARRRDGIATKLVYLAIDADDADALGNEPVLDGERLIGVTTGGAFGHTVGRSLAFAYVEPARAAPGATFDISLLGRRRRAEVLPRALHDPDNHRPRA
ncbi:MAG: FAD-dependent oxidoreductase [Gammaproteobacteria bacterium]|nr:FAD-dependent oxidoreductase [Gammaproteobacteria bacterium]